MNLTRKIVSAAACCAVLLSAGCAVLLDNELHRANRKPCEGLPGPAKQDCMGRRGEREVYGFPHYSVEK